jgi:transcriptional regulator with XRE-family HTH domain
MKEAFAEISATEDKMQFPGETVENALCKIAELFDVPRFAAKQRARQLGLEAADGAFVYVDGKWHEPFVFENGNLGDHQTYVIDRASYEKLYRDNADFAQLIVSGKYIYLGYVVCINDPKYIKVDFIGNRAELKLSDYAREYADECCLKFSFKSSSYLREMQDKYEFYGESYLSKEVKSDNYVEHYYDKDFNLKCEQTADDISKEVAQIKAAQEAEDKVKLEVLQNHCITFADTLIYHMDRKHITVEDLMERSGLSDTTIKKYRAGTSNPPIENAMAVCIGLNLPKAYSKHLIETCSYTLGDSPRDRAYKVCLDHDEGTLEQWNMILTAFGQPTIPNLRNQKTK